MAPGAGNARGHDRRELQDRQGRYIDTGVKIGDNVEALINKGAAIGANATIVCGVTLHDYCMIAAGAVVLSDVPALALIVGNPGRVTGYVCKCGTKLELEKLPRQGVSSRTTVCHECGKTYEFQLGLIPVL